MYGSRRSQNNNVKDNRYGDKMGNSMKFGKGFNCFKCGEPGHKSFDCPQSGGGKRNGYNNNNNSKGDGCYKCGEQGHFARECPQSGGGRNGSSNGFRRNGGSKFGNGGSKYGSGGRFGRRGGGGCSFCGEEDHGAYNCETRAANEKLKEDLMQEHGRNYLSDFGLTIMCPGSLLVKNEWEQEEMDKVKFQKNFSKQLYARNVPDNFDYKKWLKENKLQVKKNHQFITSYKDLAAPMLTFEKNGFDKEVVKKFADQKFEKPTTIQSVSWPIIFSGHDMISIAKTGCGKTCAFLIPGIIHLKLNHDQGNNLMALIVNPTRELALQTEGEMEKFNVWNDSINYMCVYGGSHRGAQSKKLQKYKQQNNERSLLICSTPGRLLDFMEASLINLDMCSYLCLDEADRLMDMGFEPSMRAIVHYCHPKKQFLLFSATWPQKVDNFTKDNFLKKRIDDQHDVYHTLLQSASSYGNGDSTTEVLQIAKNINQKFHVVSAFSKKFDLMVDDIKQLLDEHKSDKHIKVLCFMATKRDCDDISDFLGDPKYFSPHNVDIFSIHGDKTQHAREYALKCFKQPTAHSILFGTDVASRGLHIPDINLVINFDAPNNAVDYIHRCGRTGRLGKNGTSITMFENNNQDASKAKSILDMLIKNNLKPPPELKQLAQRASGYHDNKSRSKFGNHFRSRRRY